MPFTRTAERSENTQINGLRLRKIGTVGRVPAAPIFIAAGITASSTSAVSINWPSRHIEGDLGIMVIEASGNDSTVTPTGWIHVEGSPVVDIADATGSKLMVLYRFALNDAEESITVPDPGDHSVSRIFAFRGVRQDIAPGRAFATGIKNIASTSVTWPAINTLSPNSLVLCIASRPDDVSSTAIFSAFTNANLIGVAEASEGGTTSGNGGGFVLNYGTRADLGDIGASSGTMTVSVTNAVITLALEPSLALPA
jgi:hypothetical protein